MFGTPEQQERWLGRCSRARSARLRDDRAGRGLATRPTSRARSARDGDEYVVDARKWFITGAADERCKVALVLGARDPDAPRHARHSIMLVPMDAPGVTVVRNMRVFGFTDPPGHAEVMFEGVRVPAANLVGEQGGGFAIAQARLARAASTTACARSGWPSGRWSCIVDRARIARGVRRPAGGQGLVRPRSPSRAWRSSRRGCSCSRPRWMIDTVGARAARGPASRRSRSSPPGRRAT